MSVFCALLFVGLSIGTERLYEFCGEIFLAYRSIGLSCQLLVFFASKELLLIIDPDSFGANVYCRKFKSVYCRIVDASRHNVAMCCIQYPAECCIHEVFLPAC